MVQEILSVGASEKELLGIAAAAETSSEHPLAQAIVNIAFERKVTPVEVTDFAGVPGRGVRARIEGTAILAGSPRFLEEEGVELGSLSSRIRELEELGRTVIAIARNGNALGIVALGDRLRADAAKTVAALRQTGIKPILLTGDNERNLNRRRLC